MAAPDVLLFSLSTSIRKNGEILYGCITPYNMIIGIQYSPPLAWDITQEKSIICLNYLKFLKSP